MIKQFDIVKIINVKIIRFVSGPPGQPANPDGMWSVVGFVGNEILIAKDDTIARAPLSAVSKIASFKKISEVLEN